MPILIVAIIVFSSYPYTSRMRRLWFCEYRLQVEFLTHFLLFFVVLVLVSIYYVNIVCVSVCCELMRKIALVFKWRLGAG